MCTQRRLSELTLACAVRVHFLNITTTFLFKIVSPVGEGGGAGGIYWLGGALGGGRGESVWDREWAAGSSRRSTCGKHGWANVRLEKKVLR